MVVRCVKLLNADGKAVESSPWLALGKAYRVFSMTIDRNGKAWFRIISNDRDIDPESLGIHSSECFEVLSNQRPSSWRDRKFDGEIETAPGSWLVPEFWGRLFDGEEEAFAVFQRERRKIVEEEALIFPG
jgi:hypothetical protein